MTNSTPKTYTRSVVILHWLIALLVIAMIPLGKNLAALDPGPDKLMLMRIHASVGIAILIFSLARLYLHFRRPRPAPGAEWATWTRISSTAAHWALMAITLLATISGLGAFTGYGYLQLVQTSQWQPWPDGAAIPPLNVHHFLVTAIIALVILHAAAACYHQFIRKDGLLKRMWFSR